MKETELTQTQVNKMTIWKRLISPSPKFFRRLGLVGGTLFALTTPFLVITSKVSIYFTYINAIGAAMLGVSKLTVDHQAAGEEESKT